MKKLNYLLAGALAMLMSWSPVQDVNAAQKGEKSELNYHFTTKWKRGKDGVIRWSSRQKNSQLYASVS